MKFIHTVLCVALAAAGTSASAVNLNLNTGAGAWQVKQTTGVVTNNGAALNSLTSAVVLTGTLPFAANLPGFEAFAWANPFGGAVWVGQLATDGQFTNGGSITCGSPCGATAGNYVYTYSFASQGGGSLVLNGFTGDNGVRSLQVTQGATVLYGCTAGGPGTLCAATQTAVTASTGTLNFAAGSNITITALVQNLDGPGRNPSGFILAGSAQLTPENTLPENLACATNAVSALPPSSLAPAAAKSKTTLLNLLNTASTYQAGRYWSLSLAGVRSAKVLVDGCALRGTPDTAGDADLVTNCPAQAPIYACLRDAETQLTTPPPGK